MPIEVKLGKDYTRHAALNHVLANPVYGIEQAIVFSNDNVREDGKVSYYPIYMMMFLEKKELKEDMIYKPDFRILQ